MADSDYDEQEGLSPRPSYYMAVPTTQSRYDSEKSDLRYLSTGITDPLVQQQQREKLGYLSPTKTEE